MNGLAAFLMKSFAGCSKSPSVSNCLGHAFFRSCSDFKSAVEALTRAAGLFFIALQLIVISSSLSYVDRPTIAGPGTSSR